MISVLFAARNSTWHSLPGVDVWDIDRDARRWPGGSRVIAHPPCRGWSKYVAHQSHATLHEVCLGLWAIEIVRRFGGVVEQPAGSRLLDPVPPGGQRMFVEQGWFGHRTSKPTWLWFAQVPLPATPFALSSGSGHRAWQVLSKHQRSATCSAFAAWLLEAVRQ